MLLQTVDYNPDQTIMDDMSSVKDIIQFMNQPAEVDIALITKAYNFAQEAHQNHERKSGDPYFVHLVETAKILAELGMGPKTVSAGLLHDSIEDVGIMPETIDSEFGSEVLRLVEGVTKLGTLKYKGVTRHTESLRKLFVAMSQDIRVVIIKFADRLHNMRTLEHVDPEKQHRIALETLEIYAPVAERLGMGRLKGELEDLAFPYIYPEKYEEVKKLLAQKNTENSEHLEKVSHALEKEFRKQGIKDFEMDYRVKRLYSLFRKLERKNWDIDKILDLSALRILVPTVSDCYKILGVIHSNWRPLPGKIKDYIAFQKPNGYQSLHTTIFTGDGGILEIQIRTREMHYEAEFGIASHLSYKNFGTLDTPKENSNLLWIKSLLPSITALKRQLAFSKKPVTLQEHGKFPNAPEWVKQLAETQHNVSQSEEFLNTLRTDFFNHRIFIFTPQGDVVDLPINSTPIDFAYAIHSDIGNHIAGAKVNAKMTALDTELKNGDIVEILTKSGNSPTIKWLDVARTSLARRQIQSYLNKHET